MTTFDYAAISLSAHPAPEVDVLADMLQAAGTMTIQPVESAQAPLALDEPSSLALMLIGIVTLAAYRGVVKRVTAQKATKAPSRPLVKPRRAA